jgi:hypothetical protein
LVVFWSSLGSVIMLGEALRIVVLGPTVCRLVCEDCVKHGVGGLESAFDPALCV